MLSLTTFLHVGVLLALFCGIPIAMTSNAAENECDLCIDISMSPEEDLVIASLGEAGLLVNDKSCAEGSYSNEETMYCSSNLCGRGLVQIEFIPYDTDIVVLVNMTSRSCYNPLAAANVTFPEGRCIDYDELAPELQLPVQETVEFLETFRMDGRLLGADFCACEGARCNGEELDQFIEEYNNPDSGAGIHLQSIILVAALASITMITNFNLK